MTPKSNLDEIHFDEKFAILTPVAANVTTPIGEKTWESFISGKTIAFNQKGFDSVSQAYNSAVYKELKEFIIIS